VPQTQAVKVATFGKFSTEIIQQESLGLAKNMHRDGLGPFVGIRRNFGVQEGTPKWPWAGIEHILGNTEHVLPEDART
jgi:hypothetical protein